MGPEFVCDICWKTCFRQSVRHLDASNYLQFEENYNDCRQKFSQWICNPCHAKLVKGKMPPDAISNDLSLCEQHDAVTSLNDIEHVLICQSMPFMSIVARHKGAQSGLKGQVVLVPTDLTKVQKVLPRTCNDDHLISIALKRRLKDNSSVIAQNISPAKINAALKWLRENNPLYSDTEYDTDWEKAMQESDPELWNMLTETDNNNTANDDNENYQAITDSDSDDDNNEQIHKLGVPHPTVLQSIDGPDISVDDIVEIAPGEGKIPIHRNMEPNCEALAFPKHFATGEFHYNVDRKEKLTPLKYFQSRVKCKDSRFAADSRYVYFAMDWVERDAVHNSITFSQRRSKQINATAGQLRNAENVKKFISDDEMYTIFKKIRGTPQYFKDMQLDVLAKVRRYGVPTFFMTWSAAQFQWNHLIKIVARSSYPYQLLSDDDIDQMDWNDKVQILKRNPVTAARQIDHIFESVWKDVVMSGLHPIGQILNFDERGEFTLVRNICIL